MMRATSPSGSAFRIMCSTTRDRFREVGDRHISPRAMRSGETPVPCIECNRAVKFRDLLDTARELGAAGARHRPLCRLASSAPMDRARWCARADADRDQSYFLFATTREQLDYLRFPLGDMTKPRGARAGAPLRARRSPTSMTARTSASCRPAATPTSSSRLQPNAMEPGDIVDLDGRVLGRHDGIAHFTVGQRKGLGIASGQPLYVVRLDAATRRVVVGPREALRMDRIALRDVNWIGDGALDRAIGGGLEIFVRVRSTRAPQPAWLRGGRRPLRSRTRRGRGGRLARTGLRVLRRGLGPGARARRRLHPERRGEARIHQATRAARRGRARIR